VAAAESLHKAAKEQQKGIIATLALEKELEELGFPQLSRMQSMPIAPYDFISDNLRGIKGTMLDMYRRPDKLLEAINRILPF